MNGILKQKNLGYLNLKMDISMHHFLIFLHRISKCLFSIKVFLILKKLFNFSGNNGFWFQTFLNFCEKF